MRSLRRPFTAALPAAAVLLLLILQVVAANGPDPPAQDTLRAATPGRDSAAVEADDSAAIRAEVFDALPAVDSLRVADVSDSLSVDGDSTGAKTTEADSAQSRPAPIPLDQLRVVENNSFGVGERLEFEISYGPIKAGTGIMEVKEIAEVNGRNCYRVISTARSNRFFSAIYRVEDRVESFIDVKGLFPWKFRQKLREGKHRADRWAVYDQVNHTAATNRGDLDMPPYVQDVLSIMYYARTREMAVGETLYVDSHSGRKVYPLAVKILRRERVEVPAGDFDCLVVEPMLKAGGLFKHEGRIWVWLTDDSVKLPVLMKTKVIIGTVDAKLKTYRLGKIL
jgi:hypothetical protein